MNRVQYFFLMLKQGIKGVFRFKAQFVIILILSFMATLILSLSLSVGLRIQDSYDNVMKPLSEFAFETQLRVAVKDDDTNHDLAPARDIVSGDYTTFYRAQSGNLPSVASGTDNSATTAYNFILAHAEDYATQTAEAQPDNNHKNFVNEVYQTPEFKAAFKIWDENALRMIMFTSLIDELDSLEDNQVNSNLRFTPIGQYTLKNPGWYDELLDKSQKPYKIADWVNNLKLRKEHLESTPGTAEKLTYFMYLLSANDKFVNYYNVIRREISPKLFGEDSTDLMTPNQLYALIFGDYLDPSDESDVKVNSNWIISESNPIYSIILNSQEDKSKYQFLNQTSEIEGDDYRQLIANNGLRGITSPFIDMNQEVLSGEQAWRSIQSLNYNWAFNLNWRNLANSLDIFEDLSFFLTNTNLERYSIEYSDRQILGIFLAKQRLAMQMFDFDLKVRRESTFFDAPHQISFRGIILDPYGDNFNMQILKGRNVIQHNDTSGEVVLSEQFAKINGNEIGDMISAGNGAYLVVGYGTDALSFIPSQDLLNPLPNPRISAFVYGNREVIHRFSEETAAFGGAGDSVSQTLNLVAWDKHQKNDVSYLQRKDAYVAALQDDMDQLDVKHELIRQTLAGKHYDDFSGDVEQAAKKLGLASGLTDFDHSNYRYSWIVPPMVIKGYLIGTCIASAIITVIVIIALVICVRKTIDFNSKQIGILKAMGARPAEIAISYISYSIIISLIIIPLGWIVGTLMQIPFANQFMNYFSITPDIIYFDWISFVVAFLLIGILSGVVAYVSAYAMTNRSVMQILNTSVKWHSSHFLERLKTKNFKNSKFRVRFSVTLASAGSHQIWLMSIVVLLTSILITTSLAIPSIAATTSRLYYRSIRYANEYKESRLTTNAPLSKVATSYWEGHDALDEDYVHADLKLDNSNNTYGYYKNVSSYISTISGSMVLPQYLYDEKGETYQTSYMNLVKDMQNLLPVLTGIFGNNFYNVIGTGFSIGMIDALYGIILQSLDSFNLEEEQIQWTDEEKIQYAQEFSSWLTSSIPQIISAIVQSTGDSGDVEGSNDDSWKEKIMGVLYAKLPSYIKSYIQRSPSRLDQYAITYQTEIYIPGEETMVTRVPGTIDGKDLNLLGLDYAQNAIQIKAEDHKKAYLPQEIKDEIQKIMNGEYDSDKNLVYDGMTLYDVKANRLTLPVLPNRQAQSYYNFRRQPLHKDFTLETQKMQFLIRENGGTFVDLPKGAWIYDDSSFVNLLGSDHSPFDYDFEKIKSQYNEEDIITNASGTHYYLDPYMLDNNKMSFMNEYKLIDDGQTDAGLKKSKDSTQLVNQAYLFKDFLLDHDKSGQKAVSSVITRPYYQSRDMKLMLPKSKIVNLEQILYPDGNKAKDPNAKNDTWYVDNVSNDDIPKSVREAWGNPGGEWLVINPYDLKYNDPNADTIAQATPGSTISNLLGHPSYWFVHAGSGHVPAFSLANTPRTYKKDDLKVDLESVGDIVSFNGNMVVMDSDLANMLMDIPTGRNYQYNYSMFGELAYKAGTPDANGYISQFDRYKAKNEVFSEENDGQILWQPKYSSYASGLKAEDYAPHRWYNEKLSNITEPLTYSTMISYAGYGRLGNYAIGLGSWTGINNHILVIDSTLLSESRALMNQISKLAISVGLVLIISVIITSSLLIMLVGDIYIAQYRRFMVLMRALGYSNSKIMGYTLGTVTVISAIMLVVGHAIGWAIISAIILSINYTKGFALPFGFNWWAIVANFVIIILSYFGSLYVSSYSARHDAPTKILTETAE